MILPKRLWNILYLLLFVLCSGPRTGLANTTHNLDSTAIEKLQTKAINSLLSGRPDISESFFQEAQTLALKEENLEGLLSLVKTYGKVYRDKIKDSDQAIAVFRLGTESATGLTPKNQVEWDAQASLYVNLAYMLNAKGAFTEAVSPYEMALRIFDEELDEESEYTALYVYRYLGNIYTRLGEYTAAETLLLRAYQVFSELGKNDMAAESCSDLGILYRSWNKNQKAIEQYEKGILRVQDEGVSKAILHINLAKVYWEAGIYQKVKEESLNAIAILQQYDPSSSYYKINQSLGVSFELLARVASRSHQRTFTLQNLDSAYNRLILEYGTDNRREMGKFYRSAAESYLRLDMLIEAQEAFQKSLQSVLINYQPASLDELPPRESFYAENTIMEALSGLSKLYKVKFKKSKNKYNLIKALQCHQLIYVVDQELRRSYLYDSSKLFNLEESRDRSEQGIEIAQQLYELTGEENYLYEAFVFAERNRSSLLREAYRTTQANALAGISEAELAAEEALKYQISEAQEELFRLRATADVPDSLVQQAEQQLFQARAALDDWITTLEANNPRYFQLKYADEVPDLERLQEMLCEGQLMVEYFIGQEQLYVFTLDQDRLQLHQLPLPENLQERVIKWRRNIQDYQNTGVDKAALVTAYQAEGYRLYQELLLPILQGQAYAELLIIPSGILDLLPFEALLTQPVNGTLSFQAYPYLLKDYTVSYTYSASLQLSLSQLPRLGEDRLGFAPNFDGSNGWAPVRCSGNSLSEQLRESSDALRVGKEATIAAFTELAGRYRLLHLATHAQANPEQGDFSFIVFSDGAGGYDSLYAKDLYSLSIPAELVILSACETALGTIYNSEGVISLARAFHFAGVRSVLTTLWSINDGANCSLMPVFYEHLNAGASKKEGLRMAKLSMLEDPRLSHPAYWAGFQLLGNPRPLEEPRNKWLWLGLCALGIGGVYTFYKSKKNINQGFN